MVLVTLVRWIGGSECQGIGISGVSVPALDRVYSMVEMSGRTPLLPGRDRHAHLDCLVEVCDGASVCLAQACPNGWHYGDRCSGLRLRAPAANAGMDLAVQPPPPQHHPDPGRRSRSGARYRDHHAALTGTAGRPGRDLFELLYQRVDLLPLAASLLRGQYVHNHAVYTNGPPGGGFETFRDLGLESDTIATRLQDAGYRTALFGKYLNRYPFGSASNYIPAGWNEWNSPSPTNPGYSQFNYTLNENGTLVHYGSDPEDYLQDVISAKAQSFITQTIASGQPFFVYFAAFSPHTPSTPAPRHSTMFTGTLAPRTPSFNELDVSDKPLGIQTLPLLDRNGDPANRRRVPEVAAVDAGG